MDQESDHSIMSLMAAPERMSPSLNKHPSPEALCRHHLTDRQHKKAGVEEAKLLLEEETLGHSQICIIIW